MRQCVRLLRNLLFRFQSTHPLRDATSNKEMNAIITTISIHAPLTGCDSGALHKVYACPAISIHASLTGCDMPAASCGKASCRFQSTHPLRDATRKRSHISLTYTISIHAPLTGCDPTIPSKLSQLAISIHAPLTGWDKSSS